jgi:methanogenic corrinoid protein MtbC1
MECNENSLQKYLNENDKDASILCSLQMLENKDISVVNLFENILIPGLTNFSCSISQQECMWKYKVRKLISKSIINSSYPYVIKQKKKSNKIKTIVCCPREEANEIFDDVVNDYLVLAGYDSINIGAESDYDEIENALQTTGCQILVLSVTNCIHVIRARKLIEHLKKDYGYLKIAVYGPGFSLDSNRDQVEFDYYITDYKSVAKMEDK